MILHSVMLLDSESILNSTLNAKNKSVILVPIKDGIHHFPSALFYDIPGSGRSLTTYPGRGAV